ncbi:MAG: hypothetical protein K1000chlam2_01403, partial [Chlamydiae bacterium]|nr:hypothetical protein [Chlamydiota bacterium]
LMKVEGRTLVDFLEEIYKKHGIYLERQRVIEFPPGHEGMEKMQQMMEKLRKENPKQIGDQSVDTLEDYKTSLHGLPPSNVLLFRLSDKSKVVVRPSGTEPKLKIYAGVQEPFEKGMPFCEDKIQKLLDAVEQLF